MLTLFSAGPGARFTSAGARAPRSSGRTLFGDPQSALRVLRHRRGRHRRDDRKHDRGGWLCDSCYVAFLFVIHVEEAYLEHTFGEPYRQYMTEVPRFLSDRVRLFRESELLSVRPQSAVSHVPRRTAVPGRLSVFRAHRALAGRRGPAGSAAALLRQIRAAANPGCAFCVLLAIRPRSEPSGRACRGGSQCFSGLVCPKLKKRHQAHPEGVAKCPR